MYRPHIHLLCIFYTPYIHLVYNLLTSYTYVICALYEQYIYALYTSSTRYIHPIYTYHTVMYMLLALLLVVAHDLSEYRYMDDVTRNLFSLFCSTWRAVLKMFVGLFRIKASEILEKSSTRGNYNRKKNEEKGTKKKKLLTTLECLNYEKSSQQLPSCFIAMRDSPFCKMFSPLFCFEQGKTLKNFSKKLYAIKMKEKRRSRDER